MLHKFTEKQKHHTASISACKMSAPRKAVMSLFSFGLCPFQLWEGVVRGLAALYSLLQFTVSCEQTVPQPW